MELSQFKAVRAEQKLSWRGSCLCQQILWYIFFIILKKKLTFVNLGDCLLHISTEFNICMWILPSIYLILEYEAPISVPFK